MGIRWVCFDVGETLFDECGYWGRWADWLGVPRADLLAELEMVVRRGMHHSRALERFRAGFDVERATAARIAAGDDPGFRDEDLFADVRPCLAALRERGFRIGVAGNTSGLAEIAVGRCGLPLDLVASSARWCVEKPDPGFFKRLAEACGVPPAEIAYVGDRIDNDVLPAGRAGMTGAWLRRGTWARVHRVRPEAALTRYAIDGLDELPALVDSCQ